MGAKLTLSFSKETIEAAKSFAAEHNISLSRLTELLYRKMTERQFVDLEELPISEWVSLVSEGKPEYQKKNRSRHDIRDEYLSSRR